MHFLSRMLFCDKFIFQLLKSSHYLIKLCHEGIWQMWRYSFSFILGIRWDQPVLCLGCFTPHIHWIGSWVGQTGGPDALARKKNILPLPPIEPRCLCYPVHMQVTILTELDIQVTMHRDKFIQQNQPDALIFQIYFGNKTLHVLDSSSVHHQEFFTVHTAMV